MFVLRQRTTKFSGHRSLSFRNGSVGVVVHSTKRQHVSITGQSRYLDKVVLSAIGQLYTNSFHTFEALLCRINTHQWASSYCSVYETQWEVRHSSVFCLFFCSNTRFQLLVCQIHTGIVFKKLYQTSLPKMFALVCSVVYERCVNFCFVFLLSFTLMLKIDLILHFDSNHATDMFLKQLESLWNCELCCTCVAGNWRSWARTAWPSSPRKCSTSWRSWVKGEACCCRDRRSLSSLPVWQLPFWCARTGRMAACSRLTTERRERSWPLNRFPSSRTCRRSSRRSPSCSSATGGPAIARIHDYTTQTTILVVRSYTPNYHLCS